MTITTAICNSFKRELLLGTHDFVNDVIMAALYTDVADLGAGTTVYSATNEVTGTGYTAGGEEINVATGYPALNGNFAEVRFDTLTWDEVTTTFRGVLFYNQSKGNKAIAVYDRGQNVTVVAGPIVIRVPLSELAPVTVT